MILFDGFHGNILAHFRIVLKLYSHSRYGRHQVADIMLGQTVFRYSVHEDAAGFLHLLINRDLMSGLAQIICGCQACGACSHDTNLLTGLPAGSRIESGCMFQNVISQSALYGVDAD